MIIATRKLKTKSLDSKYEAVVEALKKDPMVAVVCRTTEKGKDQAVILSPVLFNMLEARAAMYDSLTMEPEFSALKRENEKFKTQALALMDEMVKMGGKDFKVSDGCWKALKGSIFDAVDNDPKLFADPADGREVKVYD